MKEVFRFRYSIFWFNFKNFWSETLQSFHHRRVSKKFPSYRFKILPYHVAVGKTFLRWMMVFSLVYYTSLWGFSSLVALKEPKLVETAQRLFDLDKGMGGMPYFEDSLSGITMETVSLELGSGLGGIPEPEEFSKPQVLLHTSYKIQPGDTIGGLAQKFGLNQDTLISMNGITNSRLLQINKVLRMPNQDGILYTVRIGDTLVSIAQKYKVSMEAIQTANELFSDSVRVNTSLFIPGARLDSLDLQEINGNLFLWPVRGYITSNYGYRSSPFSGSRQFHSGLDIGVPMGTPIKAAMSGRVTTTSYDNSYGNYVVISHHAGYRTLYAHLSVIRTKPGAYVVTGEHIGDAGSTGLSTGPHLHFTVYKDGVTVNPRALIK
jgi:murein DD-endopeptidase MepM/ murein hydrolase activator NlpD